MEVIIKLDIPPKTTWDRLGLKTYLYQQAKRIISDEVKKLEFPIEVE